MQIKYKNFAILLSYNLFNIKNIDVGHGWFHLSINQG